MKKKFALFRADWNEGRREKSGAERNHFISSEIWGGAGEKEGKYLEFCHRDRGDLGRE